MARCGLQLVAARVMPKGSSPEIIKMLIDLFLLSSVISRALCALLLLRGKVIVIESTCDPYT